MSDDLIPPGTRIMLHSSAKRYHGGPAWIVTYAPETYKRRGRREVSKLRYLVERIGTLPGQSKRRFWADRAEFTVVENSEADKP